MDMWVMSYKLVMWLYVVITGHNRFVDLYVCEVGLGLDPMCGASGSANLWLAKTIPAKGCRLNPVANNPVAPPRRDRSSCVCGVSVGYGVLPTYLAR